MEENKTEYNSLSREDKERIKEVLNRNRGGARVTKVFIPPSKMVHL